jgi:hypothetical protein
MSGLQNTGRIPEFEQGIRAMLVERRDLPGALGVAKNGGRFVVPLPAGYDALTSVCYHKGYVLVAHPTMPALQCDFDKGEATAIDAHHIVALPGRHRLFTT